MKVSFFLIFYLALGRAREPRGRRRKLDYHKRDGNKSFLFFFFYYFGANVHRTLPFLIFVLLTSFA